MARSSLKDQFIQLAKKHSCAPSKAAETGTPCIDKNVGSISALSNSGRFDYKNVCPVGPRRLILILESPHRYEFDSDQASLTCPKPAQGETGRQIRLHIRHIAKSSPMRMDDDFDLILVNAVQYQCSLGTQPLNKAIRNKVFEEFWSLESAQNDFKERLSTAYRSDRNDVILNCCTGGKRKNALRQKVTETIQKWGKNAELFRGCHPSSWRYPSNKKVEK